MEADREAAKQYSGSILNSWVYRLVDNPDTYQDSPICIQAYPVLKHSLKSFVYLDIHPTRWNRDPSNYGKSVQRRQLDNSGRPKVFFEKKALIKDYVRRKTAEQLIYEKRAERVMERLEYAQLRGNIPVSNYRAVDWSQS